MAPGAVLVTAFEPFGGGTVNASWEAARRIDGLRCGESVATVRLLPCAYDACVAELILAVETLRPVAVVMSGQAASRQVVCVERVARNRAHPTARDNCGRLGSPATGGPDMVETTAPTGAIVHAIRAAGVAARASTDAGDYVCNHLYYHALRRLAESREPTPAVFVHLPAVPCPGRDGPRGLETADAVRALRAAVQVMASATLRTQCVG